MLYVLSDAYRMECPSGPMTPWMAKENAVLTCYRPDYHMTRWICHATGKGGSRLTLDPESVGAPWRPGLTEADRRVPEGARCPTSGGPPRYGATLQGATC